MEQKHFEKAVKKIDKILKNQKFMNQQAQASCF